MDLKGIWEPKFKTSTYRQLLQWAFDVSRVPSECLPQSASSFEKLKIAENPLVGPAFELNCR